MAVAGAACRVDAYAFGSASNHRSTSSRRQPIARDFVPPSLTGGGNSPSRTRRQSVVREIRSSASTSLVRRIAG